MTHLAYELEDTLLDCAAQHQGGSIGHILRTMATVFAIIGDALQTLSSRDASHD